MIQLCHFQWSSLKLAEVNLKHGSEIPIEAPRSLRGKQCLVVGGWWLVTWSLHGPYMVLTWSKMRSPHSDDSNHSNPIWPGGLVGISTETHQRQAKHQPVWTGISQERPDEELCSLKVEGVSHRVAAPGIGVWMLGSVKDLWILPMHPTTPWRVRYGKHHLPRNPAFDVTPASLISGIVTDCGLIPKRSQTKGIWMRERGSRTRGHFITIWQ